MNEKIRKVRNMLENVIRASNVLLERGILEEKDGNEIIRGLKGIRRRFLSEEYMRESPVGEEVDKIDEMILPLDRVLVEAGKRKYKNTIDYVLKTVIYGTGVGHRILTDEEKKEEVLVLLKRRMKVSEYMDLIREAKKLDEKLSSRSFILERQAMLRRNYETCQKKIEQIKAFNPDIMEEILYYADVDEMSEDAARYVNLRSSMGTIQNSLSESEKDLQKADILIRSYEKVLNITSSSSTPEQEEADKVSEKETADTEEASAEELSAQRETQSDGEQSFEEKMQEMQNLMQKFIEEEGPSMVDLGYEAMERAFSSKKMKKYAADSLRDFEDCGLAGLEE